MRKTVLLIVLVLGIGLFGIGLIGFGDYFTPPLLPNFVEPPEDDALISNIPLYDGETPPEDIPIYENDVGITPVEPNK